MDWCQGFCSNGVTIGQGAVVGATDSVYKNVEPWAVVGGNSVKEIKTRMLKKCKSGRQYSILSSLA